MNYYKLEAVQETLRQDYEAQILSVAAEPCVEVWQRSSKGHVYQTFLAWEHEEMLLTEEEVVAAAEALYIQPGEFIQRIRHRGGLWL